jgi:hypothetical protein
VPPKDLVLESVSIAKLSDGGQKIDLGMLLYTTHPKLTKEGPSNSYILELHASSLLQRLTHSFSTNASAFFLTSFSDNFWFSI